MPTILMLEPFVPVSVTVSDEVLFVVVAFSVVAATGRAVVLPNPAAGGVANSPSTKAVDAICVVFVLAAAVGAVGVPVSAGDPLNTAEPLPVSSERTPASCAEVVLANCDRLPVVSARLAPHEKPLLLVQSSALFVPLQLGTDSAVGDAVDAVALPITVLAATGVSPAATIVCHDGGVVAPVETIACPAVDPAGFNNWIGDNVAAVVDREKSAPSTPMRNRFMVRFSCR